MLLGWLGARSHSLVLALLAIKMLDKEDKQNALLLLVVGVSHSSCSLSVCAQPVQIFLSPPVVLLSFISQYALL